MSAIPGIVIEPGNPEAIRPLLRASGLPIEGVETAEILKVARRNGAVVACAAVERHGDDGLLRSVAVDPGERGRGLGMEISRAVIAAARESGVQDLYLLTETAADFFPRLGFDRVERAAVPEAVRASEEFTRLCPDSAVAMKQTSHIGGTERT